LGPQDLGHGGNFPDGGVGGLGGSGGHGGVGGGGGVGGAGMDLSMPADLDTSCPDGLTRCADGCFECCNADGCGLDLCDVGQHLCLHRPDGGLVPTNSCPGSFRFCGAAHDPICGAECCQDGDCTTNVCIKGLCWAAGCNNNMIDTGNEESDIDCGGACQKCELGRNCRTQYDCISMLCDHGKCADSGIYAYTCPQGQKMCGPPGYCAVCCTGDDCSTGACGRSGQCIPWHCADGARDGDESDVDCGGGLCNRCLLDASCHTGSDCASGRCDGSPKKCVPPA
jgi:hypothetical protein